MAIVIIIYAISLGAISADDSYISYEPLVACNETYIPSDCAYPQTTLENIITLEDFDRCGPAVLPLKVRNFYWGAAGRKRTYYNNFEGFRRLHITPRMLHDVSKNSLHVNILGKTINFPVGISPTSAHKLADPVGESGTASAAASVGTVMILSMTSQTTIEDVAKAAFSVNPDAVLWMHASILKNRSETQQLIRRAEKSGFSAIVISVDYPIDTTISCKGRQSITDTKFVNLYNGDFPGPKTDASLTLGDLSLVKRSTKLPIVAKGVMTALDAVRVAQAGASAVMVSNHGGRQLDNEQSTIEVLPDIVNALKQWHPNVEVYIDGGIRNGWDVFKALSRGAKVAFVGRPALWGLAIGGEQGVRKMLTILRNEFNESMLIAGYANPREIYQESNEWPTWPLSLLPATSVCS